MFRSHPRDERHSRVSLRTRAVSAAIAAVLTSATALLTAPAAFAADQAFAVTSPQSGSMVSSTTPTFTGTGTSGDTVTLTYSGQQLGSYTAGTATIDGDGNWSTSTDFSKANPGETETRVRVVETTPAGVEEPNGTFFITITFPTAPVQAAVFTLDSPTEGETRDDTLNLVPFVGTGGAGNTITVTYFDGRGGLATAGTGTVGSDGNFRVLTSYRDLPADQTFVNTFTTQTTPSGDRVANEIGRNFMFATAPVQSTPFSVTSPENGSTVDSTTPEFTGTGAPGDTVELTYGGQGLQNYSAGAATVGDDGTWTVPTTDFSSANFDEDTTRVRAVEYLPSGDERPNSNYTITITFPEAPVQSVEFTLTSPVEGETRSDFLNIVHFVGTGVAGDTVTVRYFGANGLTEAGAGEVRADGTFDVFTQFSGLAPGATSVQTFSEQTDPAGDAVAPEIARSFSFATAPVPLYPFTVTSPANGSTVDSLTPAYTGQGTPGDTVTVTYSGQGLQNYEAGTTTAAADGSWSIPTTDFSKAPLGDTEVRTRVVETTPQGVEEPNGTLFITITFPSAPGVQQLAAPTLDQPIVNGTSVTFSGTGEPGATIEVAVVTAPATTVRLLALAAPTTVSATVGADGRWTTTADFEPGSYSASATQFTGSGADRSDPTAARLFTVAAVAGSGGGTTPTTPASDSLASTGTDATTLVELSLLLLTAGGLVLLVRRGRSAARR